MTGGVRVRAPSRLHFGLLARGPGQLRQFGGVGLMVDDPGLDLSAEPSSAWAFEGPRADRVEGFARAIASRLEGGGIACGPARIRVHRAPPEHNGLGAGTALGLAVARALLALAGRPEAGPGELAALTGRGARSGIGLHGFARGGLIVDGGRGPGGGPPPLLARLDLPPEWSVAIVLPDVPPGLHGVDERAAFARLPPIPGAITDRLCRLALLGLLPAVAEADLDGFGRALAEIQDLVGASFASAQGGTLASRASAEIADAMRAEGLHGVGQSSWGPALYGFTDRSGPDLASLSGRLRGRCGLTPDRVLLTRASVGGAVLIGPSSPS